MAGRSALVAMIPVNLLLIAWVWMGRVFFGVGGWFLLIFLFTLVPLLLMLLTISTVLAFTQPGRPRTLTRGQSRAQAVLWAGLFVAGAFTPDFGEIEEDTTSLLTQLFGDSPGLVEASGYVALAGGAVAAGGYVALLVTLTVGRRQPERAEPAEVRGAR